VQVQSFPLSEGDDGVTETVHAMIGLIDLGKKSGDVQECAAKILREYHVPAFDFRREARAVFDWVKRNIRFTRDPTGKEGIRSADTTLRLGIADCDCFSILMCSLLGTIGHRTRLVTISNHPQDPSQFSHIYPEVRLDGAWVPVDAGRKNPAFAKGPRNYFRKRVWDCDTGEYVDLSGIPAGATMRAARRSFTARPGMPGHLYGLGAMRAPVRARAILSAGRSRQPGLSFASPNWHPSQAGRVPQPRTRLGASWDWSAFESQLPALTTAVTGGTATIIRAENAPAVAAASPYGLYPTTPSQYPAVTGSIMGIDPTLLLIGGGLLAFMLMRKGGN
jgi:hypothetical protein